MSETGEDAYPPVVPAPGRDARTPGVTRDIYGMPAFVSFAVRDIEVARDWYTRGLDFIDLFSVPGPAGVPLLVHLRRWRFQDILLRPAEGEVVPGTTVTLSIAAVIGELDALADRARRHGGGRVEGPADTPWNTRDLHTPRPRRQPGRLHRPPPTRGHRPRLLGPHPRPRRPSARLIPAPRPALRAADRVRPAAALAVPLAPSPAGRLA
jgi:hypothetical protein